MRKVVEANFAAAMQELSAAAAPQGKPDERVASGITALLSAAHSLGQRVEALEESVMRNFEGLHFAKLEEHLAAIRTAESVNQKLFDSLHEELISYRDNFVRDSLQKPVIRDLLVLFDDLSALAAQFEAAAVGEQSRPQDVRARDNLRNILHFVVEVLHRLDVVEVEEKSTVDRTLHCVLQVEATDCAEEDGQIARRIRRGFTWRGNLLRPEEVVVKRAR